MSEWPVCLTEAETLAKMNEGMSISRLGDGEIGIIFGGNTATHMINRALAKEMKKILWEPAENCLPAIPTMDPKSPRYENWALSKLRYNNILDQDRVYGSAFVGQSVSSPWVDTDEHVDGFKQLWKGKRVVAISTGNPEATRMRVWKGEVLEMSHLGGDITLFSMLEKDAAEVLPVLCGELEAYSQIDEIQARCIDLQPDIVVACAGPMATCLANRLAKDGIQCIDLGRGLGVIVRHVYADA